MKKEKKVNTKGYILILLFVILALALFVFKGNITGNAALEIGETSFVFPRLLIIGLILAVVMVVCATSLEEQAQRKKGENLEAILSKKELDINELVAVRAVSSGQINQKNGKIYASPFRPTVHFSLNHIVEINPMYGDWSGADTFILTPFKSLLDKNKESFYGGSTADAFFVGYARLPDDTIVLKKGPEEKPEEFTKRVEGQMEKMGFKVLPPGDWAWGGSWKASEQFKDLLKKKGYSFGAHTYTEFGQTDDKVQNAVFRKSSDRVLEKYYMAEIAEGKEMAPADFGAHVDRKGKIKFPSIKRFYTVLGRHRGVGAYPKFEEWQKMRLGQGDVDLKGESINSELMRNLYADYLKEVERKGTEFVSRERKRVRQELIKAKKDLRAVKRKANKEYKLHGKEGMDLGAINYEIGKARSLYSGKKSEYESQTKALREYERSKPTERYIPQLESWKGYWKTTLSKNKKPAEAQRKAA